MHSLICCLDHISLGKVVCGTLGRKEGVDNPRLYSLDIGDLWWSTAWRLTVRVRLRISEGHWIRKSFTEDAAGLNFLHTAAIVVTRI